MSFPRQSYSDYTTFVIWTYNRFRLVGGHVVEKISLQRSLQFWSMHCFFSDKLPLLAIVSSEFKSSVSEKTPFPSCLWQFFNSTRTVLRSSKQLAKEQKSHSNLTFRLRSHYTDETSSGWKIWPNTSFTPDRSKYFRYVHMELWTARRLYFLTAKAVLYERIS